MQVAARYHFQILMLCTALSKVGDIFTYCLLGADFVVVLVMMARIIRLKRKISSTLQQRTEAKELIVELALSELIELLVPLFFMISFMITFYGPNAYHMEGMRHSYWGQAPVTDLISFYNACFKFLAFDVVILAFSFIFLFVGCKVSLI